MKLVAVVAGEEPAVSVADDRPELPLGRRRRAYVALAMAAVMAVLDGSIANTALPTIARELHVTPATSVWVVNVFQLAITTALFTVAALGQARGLARVYRVGVGLFTFGSLCCALSHTFPLLVASRLLQGLGAAGIMALQPALFREVFPRDQLGRMLGINALIIATSAAAGPTIGGVILAFAPWPWLFAINVPLGIIMIALARGTLPESPGHGGRIDVPSILASAAGFGTIIYGLGGEERGQPPMLIALQLAFGIAMFAWFIQRQRRLAQPMLAIALYRNPTFSLATATSFMSFIAQGIGVVALPFAFQLGRGATPLQSGLLLTSWPIAVAVAAPIAGRLSDRYPAAILSTIGLAVFSAGLAFYATSPADAAIPLIVLHGAICGLGFGFFQSPNSRDIIGTATRAQSGSASGILAAMRVGGQTTGVALLGVVFAHLLGTHVGPGVTGAGANPAQVHLAVSAALWVAATSAGLAAIASAFRLRVTATAPARHPRGA